MLDSVKLASPALSAEVVRLVESRLVRRSALDLASGELLYELTSGSLEGSWDHRISCRVLRERFRRVAQGDRWVTRKVASAPYLWVEGSVHKALLGHNVWGGPEDFHAGVQWFVRELMQRLGVLLPAWDLWEVMRVDWAEVYELGEKGCRQYVRALNSALYPRRAVIRFGDESLMAPGRTTALKVYRKGPEFLVHDFKRLRSSVSDDQLHELARLAGDRLRVEVAIKRPKLHHRYGTGVKVREVGVDWLRGVHRTEVGRLVREAKRDVEVIRTSHEVSERLYQLHGDRLAGSLFATWVQLSGLGEAWVKDRMQWRTFYRHKKYLTDAGISWVDTDVTVGGQVLAYPSTFVPVPSDPAWRSGEHPTVTRALEPYRVAS